MSSIEDRQRLQQFKYELLDGLRHLTTLTLDTFPATKFKVRDLGQGQVGITDDQGHEWLVTIEK